MYQAFSQIFPRAVLRIGLCMYGVFNVGLSLFSLHPQPNIRVAFRTESLLQELNIVLELARAAANFAQSGQ
jgi:hypothetical protein